MRKSSTLCKNADIFSLNWTIPGKLGFGPFFYLFFGLLFGSLPSVSTSRNLEAGVLETRKVARTRRRKNKLIVCELVISQFNLSGRLEENDVK